MNEARHRFHYIRGLAAGLALAAFITGAGRPAAAGEQVLPWIRLTLQGEELVRGQKYEEALDYFTQAASLQQESTRLYMNMAMCHYFISEKVRSRDRMLTHYAAYLENLRRVLALDPVHADARYRMDLHLGIVSEIVPFRQPEAENLYESGRAAMRSGAMDAARTLFAKALEAEKHPDIMKSLGMIALQEQKLPEAEARFNDALNLNPVQHDIYMILGQIAERSGRLPEARQAYVRALASYPHHFAAMEKIAIVTRAMERPVRFLNLVDPLPADKQTVPYNDIAVVRLLAEELKANVFELQCWLVYHAALKDAAARLAAELPGVAFELTADRETAAFSVMLGFYRSNKEAMGVDMPQFNVLAGLMDQGLLNAALFFYRWHDNWSEDFKTYRHNHFEALVRMFEAHLCE